jgi:5-methylcytosine-specific restriction protein A
MVWGAESGRTYPLPDDWDERRRFVLARDRGECQHRDGPDSDICGYAATDVDHFGEPWDHDVNVLRAMCHDHHAEKTSRQGNAARWAYRRQRPPERHPGIIRD